MSYENAGFLVGCVTIAVLAMGVTIGLALLLAVI